MITFRFVSNTSLKQISTLYLTEVLATMKGLNHENNHSDESAYLTSKVYTLQRLLAELTTLRLFWS